jgi:hypothetical protein
MPRERTERQEYPNPRARVSGVTNGRSKPKAEYDRPVRYEEFWANLIESKPPFRAEEPFTPRHTNVIGKRMQDGWILPLSQCFLFELTWYFKVIANRIITYCNEGEGILVKSWLIQTPLKAEPEASSCTATLPRNISYSNPLSLDNILLYVCHHSHHHNWQRSSSSLEWIVQPFGPPHRDVLVTARVARLTLHRHWGAWRFSLKISVVIHL